MRAPNQLGGTGDILRFIGEKGSFVRHEFSLEADFEKRIYKFKDELFRGSSIVRWEPKLTCHRTGEGVKPDSLIVNIDMDEWWVVEIELGRRKKISAMVDQLGKLRSVDYTKHKKDIYKGLVKMGLEEAKAKERAEYFSAIPPNFMLILDKENPEMISQAMDRDFVPLVIETYRNSAAETRFLIPEEHQLTREPPPVDTETLELRAPLPPEYPDIINQNWWVNLPPESDICHFESITIKDGQGTFVGTVTQAGNAILLLSNERKSIKDITKGNKVGILTADTIEGSYNLKLKWT